jgi:asparagine synthase (glutamine-hydrolysing)
VTAIAAILGPGEERDLRRMLDAAAHRGPLPPAIWSSPFVRLGVRGSRRHGDSRSLLAEDTNGSAVVFDGRLDNRDELRGALGLPAEAESAAIVLASYARSSEEGIANLLGDFAFVLWDAPARRLIAARDHLGQRPLFHASIGGTAFIASEPQQLLAHPSLPSTINEGCIAEWLAGRPSTVSETVWSAVGRLPPAHVLTVKEGAQRVKRYWDLSSSPTMTSGSDEDYAAAFDDLFREAIGCRTRDAQRVGVFLSGGLDSSAIAAVTARLARERDAPGVHAFSLAFPGLPVDETPYSSAVVDRWRLCGHVIPAQAPAPAAIADEIDRYRDLPPYPNGMILDPLRRLAAGHVDVVLTGYGGDEWFTGSPSHTADLLREGRVMAAARQFLHDRRLPGRTYTTAGLLRTAFAPLLPPWARAVLRPVAGAARETFPWITADFARRASLADRLRREPVPTFPTEVQRNLYRIVNGLPQVLGDELEDRAAAAAGIEQRHPFNDRRLAQFGFTLPERQRWRDGETKAVLRRALGDALPDAVRGRNDKAEFSPIAVETLELLGGASFLARLRIAEAGWVDAAVVQRAYEDMRRLYSRGDEAYIRCTDIVWNVAAAELWFTRQGLAREGSGNA